MKDQVLDQLAHHCAKVLSENNEYCGLAMGDTGAVLNSTLPNGQDVTIIFKVEDADDTGEGEEK